MDIRPFRPEDRAALTAIRDRDAPPHRRHSADDWARWDAMRCPTEASLRLSVGTPAVAYLDVTDLSTADTPQPGVCDMELIVAHEHRRQRIGVALYDRALAFADSRGARRLVTWLNNWRPDAPGVAFLAARDFAELDREQTSALDLTAFDPSPFAGAAERAQTQDVRLFSYAALADTEAHRRRLYDLWMPVEQSMPTRDAEPYGDPPFARWQQQFDLPDWDARTLFIAESDGAWVGLTQIGLRENGVGSTLITGVLAPYQGRGLALALKLRALTAAKTLGVHTVTTENHADNAPMLAINAKLGFRPDAPDVSYNKVL